VSRETWRLIKSSKGFYISTYRRASTILLLSVSLNLVLGFFIFDTYFSRPDPQYYATSGATPPVELAAMDSPNNTSVPLLANDQVNDEIEKVIPQ
jgi:hypothetical protein